MEYDKYGFPKSNKIDTRYNTDLGKWIKIIIWLCIIFLVILKVIGMFLGGYFSYNEFIIEKGISKYFKIIFSFIFNELYFGHKLIVFIKNYIKN